MMSRTYRRREVQFFNTLASATRKHISGNRMILLLSLVVGVLTGLASFVLKYFVEEIRYLLTAGMGASQINFLYFLYPAVGILLTMLFVRYVVKDDISHGVTKILFAISRKRARIKSHNKWSSIVASGLTIGFGGSVGAEAPIVLTGSAIGSSLGKRFCVRRNTMMMLVGCGAAGAVASIFKAPIAGLVFVLEVLMLDLSMSSLLPLLVTCLTSTCVSYAIYGTDSMFSFSLENPFSIKVIPACLLLGVFCGLVALYFTRTMNWFEGVFSRLMGPWKKFFTGATVLGVLLLFFPALYGEGYDVINQLLNGASASDITHNSFFYGGANMLLLYLVLVMLFKSFASTATNGGGGCGGVFAPSLFLGCIAGFVFAMVWNSLSPDQALSSKNFALYGMAGLMSGIMHAPLTGIFLIAELTGGYDLFVPIMIVSVVAYLTIIVFEPHSIYTMRLAKKGELITHNKDRAILTLLNVNTLIENDYRIVRKDMNLRQFSTIISESRRNLFPVADVEGYLEGVVALDDVRKYIFRPELYHKYQVIHFMQKPKTVLRVTDSMRAVTRKFEETGAWNLPVVDEDDKYMGFISRSGLFNRYRQTLVDFSAD